MLRAFVHKKGTIIRCKIFLTLILWQKDRLLETYSYTKDRRFPCLRVSLFEAAILPNALKEIRADPSKRQQGQRFSFNVLF